MCVDGKWLPPAILLRSTGVVEIAGVSVERKRDRESECPPLAPTA